MLMGGFVADTMEFCALMRGLQQAAECDEPYLFFYGRWFKLLLNTLVNHHSRPMLKSRSPNSEYSTHRSFYLETLTHRNLYVDEIEFHVHSK